jgi:hypothetical protein
LQRKLIADRVAEFLLSTGVDKKKLDGRGNILAECESLSLSVKETNHQYCLVITHLQGEAPEKMSTEGLEPRVRIAHIRDFEDTCLRKVERLPEIQRLSNHMEGQTSTEDSVWDCGIFFEDYCFLVLITLLAVARWVDER